MNENHCLICQSQAIYQFTINRFKKPFKIYKCLSCKILFQYPQPNEDVLESFYTQKYFEDSNYKYIDERKNIEYHSIVWDNRLKIILKNMKFQKEKSFLDIGCSFCGLLNLAQKKYHFDVYGVDISSYARDYCKNNLNISNIYSSVENIKNKSFDVITMIELIEHLPSPLKTLKKCYEMLNKDGLLVIQTANFNSLQYFLQGKKYQYFLPGHLFYFSRKNLKKYLKQIGFSQIIFYQPVEVSLRSKLLKFKGQHKKQYLKYLRIVIYHFVSYLLRTDKLSITASMVLYAKK